MMSAIGLGTSRHEVQKSGGRSRQLRQFSARVLCNRDGRERVGKASSVDADQGRRRETAQKSPNDTAEDVLIHALTYAALNAVVSSREDTKMTTRRDFLGALPATGAAFALGGALLSEAGPASAQTSPPLAPGHFHPKGKAPSEHTIAALKAAREALPFDDTRDFDEFNKGLIARRADMVIKADAGHNAWDLSRFAFVDQAEEFDTIHPSMHRIAQLNQNFGLYEVIPGIYQVRGFDLSQATFVRGKTGWILFDVLTSAEPMRARGNCFRNMSAKGYRLLLSSIPITTATTGAACAAW